MGLFEDMAPDLFRSHRWCEIPFECQGKLYQVLKAVGSDKDHCDNRRMEDHD